ncbi:MAG: TRAP transporter substrate-binding protein [Proteobacteria bacterium]|nr:TRAP transporter substrate-binding protein [Pseudomonadota bacterium]
MKKILYSGTLVVAIWSLLIAFPTLSSAANVVLKYANFFPPTHSQSQLSEAWCKAVEEKTEGRVKVEYYPGGSLLKGNQIYAGLADGIADIGFSVAAYTAGRFPILSAFDLPFGYPSGVVATKVVNDVYNTLNANDFKDTKLMYLHAHGPGLINTRNKEVKVLEDMKGLRIRSTGMSAEMVKALGGTPVAMTMGDAYESLEKGVVDGSAHPAEANLGWKLGEVTKYLIRNLSCAYTTTFFVAMNKDKWAAIDAKDQKAIEAINKEWIVKHGQAWDDADKAGMEAFVKKEGNVVVDQNAEQSERWAAAVAPFIDDFGAKLSEKGVDGPKVISAIRASLKANK